MKNFSKAMLLITAILMFFSCLSTENAGEATIYSNYNIVDTGQSESFNSDGIAIEANEGGAFFGQDGDYSGLAFSFINNGDGTVTDQNTGLTWVQQPIDSESEKMSWATAVEYCEVLEFAGRDDWRLPSLKELISIEDFSDGWPYVDQDVFSFGDQEIGKHLQFWSSNFYNAGTTHEGAETAFGLNFGTGHIKGYPTADNMPEGLTGEAPSNGSGPVGVELSDNESADENTESTPPPPEMTGKGNPFGKYVWAVLGDQYGVNQFFDNGDGTISDLASGLMWMKDDAGEGLDWENALAYGEDLEYAGYDDWKLPNIKELQSIVDYSGTYPAIDGEYFNITDEDSYFWTSTSAYFSKMSDEELKKYWAWYVAFGYAVDGEGNDLHGAGATRYDTKMEGGPTGEDAERVFNAVRAVRVIK